MASRQSLLALAVDAEAKAVGDFIAVLKSEQERLGQGETESLAALAEKKSQIADELTALAKQRNELLAQEGLATDQAGVTEWLTRHPTDTALREKWLCVLDGAREARELNRLNGQIIQIHLQHTAEALEILLSAGRTLDLYGPDGQTASVANRRISESA